MEKLKRFSWKLVDYPGIRWFGGTIESFDIRWLVWHWKNRVEIVDIEVDFRVKCINRFLGVQWFIRVYLYNR